MCSYLPNYLQKRKMYTGINWMKKVDKNRWLNNLLLKLYYSENSYKKNFDTELYSIIIV